MKIPSLRSCLLACVARVCGTGSDQQPPQSFTNKPRPFFATAKKQVLPKERRAKNRFHSNQRQIRKDRRRAFAAGVKNAF